MALIRELRFVPPALARQAGLGIRGGGMRGVRATLSVEIHGGVAGIVRGRERRVLSAKALESRPRLDQRAVHGEVFRRQQMPHLGLGHYRSEKGAGYVSLQQPLPI